MNSRECAGEAAVLVAGRSDATWGTPKRPDNHVNDAFVAKLSPTGTLLWNTFLGSSGQDWAWGLGVDGNNDVVVAGSSYGSWRKPRRTAGGGMDGFVARLSPTGSLRWHTFVGGGGADYGYGLVLDAAGNAYTTGESSADWGSPKRAFAGSLDAFVAKVGPTGTLAWHTFLGGPGSSSGHAIARDGAGNLYVVGGSAATWGAPKRAFGGGTADVFVAQLSATGAFRWSTFLGGAGLDEGWGVAVGGGYVYVAGWSDDTWGNPTHFFHTYGGNRDGFLAKLTATGALRWNDFQGGIGDDGSQRLVIDPAGDLLVSGYASDSWAAPLRSYRDSWDAWVASIR